LAHVLISRITVSGLRLYSRASLRTIILIRLPVNLTVFVMLIILSSGELVKLSPLQKSGKAAPAPAPPSFHDAQKERAGGIDPPTH